MLAVANGQNHQKEDARVKSLVEEAFTCLCRDFAKDGITVQTNVPEDVRVFCVPVQIEQVLMNLILNARDAMLPGGGILKVTASADTEHVQILVSDTGRGIPPEHLADVFRPFFTTKTGKDRPVGSSSGSGVGLAFCRRIVDAHGGEISVASQPGKGSTFTIQLPQRPPHGRP
jgi:two-component system, NtrC family, sensor kinase